MLLVLTLDFAYLVITFTKQGVINQKSYCDNILWKRQQSFLNIATVDKYLVKNTLSPSLSIFGSPPPPKVYIVYGDRASNILE